MVSDGAILDHSGSYEYGILVLEGSTGDTSNERPLGSGENTEEIAETERTK